MLYATIGLVAAGLIAISWCAWAKFEEDRTQALEIKKIRVLHMKTNTMIEPPPIRTSVNCDSLVEEQNGLKDRLVVGES